MAKVKFVKGQKVMVRDHSGYVVMGQVDAYVMVRFPRCMPFCVSVKELKFWNSEATNE